MPYRECRNAVGRIIAGKRNSLDMHELFDHWGLAKWASSESSRPIRPRF
jgi:hypothetical protein